jgi:general L-amino acid transport system permease protein
MKRTQFLKKNSIKALLYQALLVLFLLICFGFALSNTITNMHQRGIQAGFGFLADPAGFDISESWIAFNSEDSYARALLVGLINTLKVSTLAILTSTTLGLLIGVGRVQSNPILSSICKIYTELFRNIPLLIQLLLWYVLLVDALPDPQSALHWESYCGDIYLNKDGLTFPWIAAQTEGHYAWSTPYWSDSQLAGGATFSPEFIALYLGLSLYTGAFIGELVRAGLLSVSKGQIQAALSLGLNQVLMMRYIIFPQALRVIIPPLTNQYLNLIKNSSLAVAIGYSDLVNISNTTLNQTGHALECVFIIMVVYLLLSLVTSFAMNAYNKRVMSRG